jgi:adenosylmethionine-8-amino-7-oxononanoate aminotransferase
VVSAAAACKRLAITREKLIEMAEEIYLKAKEAGQFSAAIGAVREIGVLSGLRIERSERGSPGEFSEMTDEQLVAELRELGITVEMDAPRSHGMN